MSTYKGILIVIWVIIWFVGGYSTKAIKDCIKEEKNKDTIFTIGVFVFIYVLLILALLVCSVEVFM